MSSIWLVMNKFLIKALQRDDVHDGEILSDAGFFGVRSIPMGSRYPMKKENSQVKRSYAPMAAVTLPTASGLYRQLSIGFLPVFLSSFRDAPPCQPIRLWKKRTSRKPT